MRRNLPALGLVIGALFPLLGVVIMYFIKYNQWDFKEFLGALADNHRDAATVLSLSLLINIIPFLFFTNKRLDGTARGILIATVIYATFVILLKFVW